MNVYVQTHDKGIHLIEAFQLLLNKYWPGQTVTVLGYAEPGFELAPNFSFVSLGEDTGPKIGGDLIDFFAGIDDEHFVYTVYSQVIIRPVLTRLFEHLVYAIEHSNRVGRIALTGDMELNQPHSLMSLADGNLAEHSQSSNYRMSAIWSIWSKGYFLKYLEPGMDLWEWETEGSARAKMDGVEILSATGRYPITCCRVYKRGMRHTGWVQGWDKYGAEVSPEDRAVLCSIMRGPRWRPAEEYVSN